MGSLSVRRIDAATLEQLRLRAERHGVTLEEEARRILKQAVAAPERLGDLAVRLFSSAYGVEDLALPERDTPEPLDFSQ
jgi:antitoxin FitA